MLVHNTQKYTKSQLQASLPLLALRKKRPAAATQTSIFEKRAAFKN
jgi:hypothetical protein